MLFQIIRDTHKISSSLRSFEVFESGSVLTFMRHKAVGIPSYKMDQKFLQIKLNQLLRRKGAFSPDHSLAVGIVQRIGKRRPASMTISPEGFSQENQASAFSGKIHRM